MSRPSTCTPVRPLGQPHFVREEVTHAEAWLAHLAAGRLGRRAVMSAAELATQRANELAVLGHAPSFAAGAAAPLGREA